MTTYRKERKLKSIMAYPSVGASVVAAGTTFWASEILEYNQINTCVTHQHTYSASAVCSMYTERCDEQATTKKLRFGQPNVCSNNGVRTFSPGKNVFRHLCGCSLEFVIVVMFAAYRATPKRCTSSNASSKILVTPRK